MQGTEISMHELILSLIKADLVNSRLLTGLEDLGLMAEDFYIDLSSPVFNLMGFKDSDRDDELNTFYLNIMDRLIQEHPDNFRSHKNSLAVELYTELLAEKKFRERLKMKENV